jgi:hypothetical protein
MALFASGMSLRDKLFKLSDRTKRSLQDRTLSTFMLTVFGKLAKASKTKQVLSQQAKMAEFFQQM